MKLTNILKLAASIALYACATIQPAVAQTTLPQVTVRCTRYTGHFMIGGHYVEWGVVVCDTPEGNTSWFEVYA